VMTVGVVAVAMVAATAEAVAATDAATGVSLK
jgi:hypothetical protein